MCYTKNTLSAAMPTKYIYKGERTMKKLLVLILVVCMVVGLVACAKPADNNPTNPTNSANTTDPTDAPKVSFKGKTLQLYGFGNPDSYTDYDAFGKGNYLWMVRAAIDEWATINGVTIQYEGSYNQNTMLAAMQSGAKPDLFRPGNQFPTYANYGISSPFTEEEYNEIAEICGTSGYLDMRTYKGEAHGFIAPWVGNSLIYYNKSLFERLGVKTPMEYFKEGNWTRSVMLQLMEEVTRDLDGDGVTDIYGMPGDTFSYTGSIYMDPETGKLISPYDRDYDYWFELLTIRYEHRVVKKTVQVPGKANIQKNVTYPMVAMQSSDCEPYNFEHLYQEIPNGDILEVVPQPLYDGASKNKKETLSFNYDTIAIAASCDEREATMDLIKYILKCGLKYISDFSLGAVKCDYPGIQGASELSKKWKDAFAQVCADRAEAIKEIDFDPTIIELLYENMANYTWSASKNFGSDVKAINKYTEINELPPASSIPAIKDKIQATLDKYNDLYAIG